MMQRVLIFGSTGQLGSELLRAPWPHRFEPVIADLDTFDFTKPEKLERLITNAKPHALVNAAAYTAVDKAESQATLAEQVNALAPQALARAAARLSIPMLHVSTDYVFDGALVRREYVETDVVGPINVYGSTKELGERLIRQACASHIILRTSWLYSSFGVNFVKTMLRLGSERSELRVVGDQVGRPTHAGYLARALLRTLESIDDGFTAFGTYHCAGDTAVSWAAFAEQIFARVPEHPRVIPIATADYPTPARRPHNSRLDCTQLHRTLGLAAQPFADELDACIGELRGE